MKMAWESETNHLICRWSETGQSAGYNPPWIQNASIEAGTKGVAPVLDFTKLSAFGGGQWYVVLDRMRSSCGRRIH